MVKQQSWFSLAILACYLLAGVVADCDTPPHKGKCAKGMDLVDLGSGYKCCEQICPSPPKGKKCPDKQKLKSIGPEGNKVPCCIDPSHNYKYDS
ncbi:hypothetical protein O0I10_012707 [Lichtheimia ornata]|uniref:Uncharacterized protein n=1 Tax=Lichtheimia ornata TaxID=688661 RepID=A0AAD7US47_9FUNG|nr:uncharacterized protein O0I10_012707 [Lichtheimia ornata]KAJ8651719.1 hypothetical protein O0I10_012707 [Lichtheimia ornata]